MTTTAKTVRDLLREAYPEQFDRIVECMKEQRPNCMDAALDEPATTHADAGNALAGMFRWADTTEGHQYWSDLADRESAT